MNARSHARSAGSAQSHTELLGEDADHVLYTNFVAADDHVIVLAVEDALPALWQHGEVLVAHRGVDGREDRVVAGPCLFVGSGKARQPAVADGASGR